MTADLDWLGVATVYAKFHQSACPVVQVVQVSSRTSLIRKFLLTDDNESFTTCEDLQLAEIQYGVGWKLDDNISMCRHVGGTLQTDRCIQWNSARILATHVVIPQDGCFDGWWNVRQTDNEVFRSVCYKTMYRFSVMKTNNVCKIVLWKSIRPFVVYKFTRPFTV